MHIGLGFGLLTTLLSFIMIAAGIAMFVLIFIVLLRTNKLLALRIEKEEKDRHQPPPGQ